MISLLACLLLSSTPTDVDGLSSTRIIEIQLELPSDYSPADFRAFVRRCNPDALGKVPCRKKGYRSRLFIEDDRLLVRVPARDQSNEWNRSSTRPGEFQQLDLISSDGFYRASAPIPPPTSNTVPKLPMTVVGGSALSLFVRKSSELQAAQVASVQAPARIVLTSVNVDHKPISNRIKLGKRQGIEALTPGLFHYRVWTNRSRVYEGHIELKARESCELALELAPARIRGEISVRIQGPLVTELEPEHDPNLFLLLESSSGPERTFIAEAEHLSVANPDAQIRWFVEGRRRVASVVFRDIPEGKYQLSTPPGFGLTPELSFARLGEVIELKLAE